ncbi:MAG TPA: hypothetical protein VFQ45_17475 [Longimicrobium sp.]|nr:hypothetical protein [Longimicrobium sp.]
MNLRCSLAAASLLLAALAGCSDASQPTLTAGRAPSRAIAGDISLVGVLQFVPLPDLSGARHAEKFIRASEGGFVSLNGFRVDIPAGSLPYDATVTIDLPTDNVLGKRLLAEFGPHGIQFNTPVTLTFPLTGVHLSGAPIEVARWENGGWTSLGGTVNALGTQLSGTTPHFSTYGGKYVLAGG